MKYFNQREWEEAIKEPLWYQKVPPFINKVRHLAESDKEAAQKEKIAVYDFFEDKYRKNELIIGEPTMDFDGERKEIDTVVIHHTSWESKVNLSRLSAIELIRLYAPYFTNPTYKQDQVIRNKPIFSGHFREGKQVFWPYHYLIRKNGQVERLLDDNEVGWHCGNWEINCRSIGIVLDGDYENKEPTAKEIGAMVEIIKRYPLVKKEKIFGHSEVNPLTVCPSNYFLVKNEQKGWKEEILKQI